MSPGNDGGKVNGRPKMGCGEAGSYGDLKKKTGEGKYDRDHIPSKAALIQRAVDKYGDLSPEAEKAIIDAAQAIAIPKSAHQTVSPTYGGRNTETLINKDALDPSSAAKRDTQAMINDLESHGADARCIEEYKKAAEKINKTTNSDYDKLISTAIKNAS